MKYITKLKLASVHQVCDFENKSTEFMLQLMQDTCKVDLDTVIAYMETPFEEKQKLFSDLKDLLNVITKLDIF